MITKSEVIFILGSTGPFYSTTGIRVQVIGSKDGKEVHSEENVFIPSIGMNRKPPFPSTSIINIDEAINFFEECVEACKKVKNDIEVEVE